VVEVVGILLFLLLEVLVAAAQIMLELVFLVRRAIPHLHLLHKVMLVVMVLM
jgi:hypothetical protein